MARNEVLEKAEAPSSSNKPCLSFSAHHTLLCRIISSRICPGTGFDDELQPHADEALNRIGSGRDAALVRTALFRDANLHFGEYPLRAIRSRSTLYDAVQQ